MENYGYGEVMIVGIMCEVFVIAVGFLGLLLKKRKNEAGTA